MSRMPRKAPSLTFSDLIRFWSYVDQSGQCWRWLGAVGKRYDTYGFFNIRGVVFRAHRLSLFMATGQWPNGREVIHSCDFPRCVNPAHLSAATHADNMADMKKKGRGNGPNRGVTHCPKGHPYSGDNLYVLSGKRYCRKCKRAHWRRTYGKGTQETQPD